MAGGRGTRLSSVAGGLPKSMMPVAGKPVLEYQIECLKRGGCGEILLVTGPGGSVIQKHFGDGAAFGVRIGYFNETKPLGTAGALAVFSEELGGDFLLLNGDVVFDIDFERFEAFHREKGALATLFAHPNDHPFDSEILATGEDGQITSWLERGSGRGDFKNLVNAGVHILSPSLFAGFPKGEPLNLDRDVLKPMAGGGRLFAYASTEYVKDMGTPERYTRVCADVEAGLPAARNLKNRQKAFFLDRDGTLNEYTGLITSPEQIQLIGGAAEAVAKINASGFLAIIVTNQPVLARGDCTPAELDRIHARLETLLGEQGAFVDAMYICPHHPDKGFKGEIPELKIACECRKPKPGLLLQAARDYNIDLEQSFMAGDSRKDVEAGRAAGCKAALLSGRNPPEDPAGAPVYGSLIDFVNSVLDT